MTATPHPIRCDRPGHHYQYAIDVTRIHNELGWSPSVTLEQGIARTVSWYLAHQDWMNDVRDPVR